MKTYTYTYKDYNVTITDFEFRNQRFREVVLDAPRAELSHILAIDTHINGTYDIFRITEDHYTCASPSKIVQERCPGQVLRDATSLVEGAVASKPEHITTYNGIAQ